jgi:hypothetical protein
MSLLIASRDAHPYIKERAYLVCDGVKDDDDINETILKGGYYGIKAELTAGRFSVDNPVQLENLNGGLALEGAVPSDGWTRGGTTLVPSATFPTDKAVIQIGTGKYGPNNRVAKLTVDGRNPQGKIIHGLHNGAYNSVIEHVACIDLTGWGFLYGAPGRKTTDAKILYTKAKNCGMGGHSPMDGCEAPDMHFLLPLVFQCPPGAIAGINFGPGTGGFHLIGGQIYDNHCPGLRVTAVLGTVDAIKIENNDHGVYIDGGGGGSFGNITLRGNSCSQEGVFDNIHVVQGDKVKFAGGRNYSNVELQIGSPFHQVRHGAYLGARTSNIEIDMQFGTYRTGNFQGARVMDLGQNNTVRGKGL